MFEGSVGAVRWLGCAWELRDVTRDDASAKVGGGGRAWGVFTRSRSGGLPPHPTYGLACAHGMRWYSDFRNCFPKIEPRVARRRLEDQPPYPCWAFEHLALARRQIPAVSFGYFTSTKYRPQAGAV